MKTLTQILLVVVLLGAAREASACSLCGTSFGGGYSIDLTPGREVRFAASLLAVSGGIAFSTASAFVIADGKMRRAWHGGSLAMGLVNLAAALVYAFVVSDQLEPTRMGFALVHAAVGVAGIALPIAGLFTVSPTVVGGRGWTGAGVRVAF